MSTKRLWIIAGGAVALVAIIVLVLILTPRASNAEPTSSPTPSASAPAPAEPTPTSPTVPSPTTPASTTPPTVIATCGNTSTDAFRSMMAANGWVSWETQDQAIGARPFDVFPNGAPEGAIVCRWGAGPNTATDNVVDLAWAPIDPENAIAAMQKLEGEGFVRLEETEGIYLAMKGPPGYTDADGWGETYFFGFDDVRWAATKADVTNYVKAPGDAG